MKHFPIFCIALLLSLCPLAISSYAQQDEKPVKQEETKPKEESKPQETKSDHHAQDQATHDQNRQPNDHQSNDQHMKDQQKNQEKQAQEQQKQQENEAKHQQDHNNNKQQEDQARHEQQQQEKQSRDQQKQQKDQDKARQEQARQQQDRASHHDNDHGHYQQANRRIPDDKFRAHFGHEHHFHVGHPVIVENRPRFQYSGYWFEFADPWPSDWSYDDDCYIDYMDDGYYLFDPVHPGVRIALTIVF